MPLVQPLAYFNSKMVRLRELIENEDYSENVYFNSKMVRLRAIYSRDLGLIGC